MSLLCLIELLALSRLSAYWLIDILRDSLLIAVNLLRFRLLSLIQLLLPRVRLSSSAYLLDWCGSSSLVNLLSLLGNLYAQSFNLERRNRLSNAAVECREVRIENTVFETQNLIRGTTRER